MIRFSSLTVLALSITLLGCSNETPPAGKTTPAAGTPAAGTPAAGNAEAGHSHPSKGPHGGPLIELGEEEYHAELIHDDDKGTVTVYVLDGKTAKAPVAIASKDVTINVKHGGEAEQFKLTAAPLEGEADGKSSSFASSDKELVKDLDTEGVDAQLVVDIGGKQYRGKVTHGHEAGHEGHDHGKGEKK